MGRVEVPPSSPRANLQHEIGVTAMVLEAAQARLVQEHEQLQLARANEENAMDTVRTEREKSRRAVEERLAEEKLLAQTMSEQRQGLEAELKRLEAEKESNVLNFRAELAEKNKLLLEAEAVIAELQEQKLVAETRLKDERELASDELREARLKVQIVQRDAEQQVKAEQDKARAAQLQAAAEREHAAQNMKETVESEREKRIEHAKEMALRRLGKKELVLGWTTWVESYHQRQQNVRALKAAANRLSRPRLVHSFAHWQREWTINETNRSRFTHQQLAAHEQARREEIEEEMEALRAELKSARNQLQSAAEREKAVKDEMEEQIAAEREKRIEHTQQMAMLRLAKRELVLGWSAWIEQHDEVQRKRRVLMMAANRLSRPRLVNSWSHWYNHWRMSRLHWSACPRKNCLPWRRQRARSLQQS